MACSYTVTFQPSTDLEMFSEIKSEEYSQMSSIISRNLFNCSDFCIAFPLAKGRKRTTCGVFRADLKVSNNYLIDTGAGSAVRE